jgi:leucine dehydrogenase
MVTTHREYDDHEQAGFCRDPEAGLTAIIAVHDTAAGPVGAVGMRLATLLHDAGAKLVVADIDPARVEDAVARFNASSAPAASCHNVDADVYAPCALGATLNENSIAELRATVVAGAANNQLATPEDGWRLAERGVLYAPDFVVNAGGVISTALEGPSFNQHELLLKVTTIASTLQDIFTRADPQQLPTSVVAYRIAQERLAAARVERSLKLSAR